MEYLVLLLLLANFVFLILIFIRQSAKKDDPNQSKEISSQIRLDITEQLGRVFREQSQDASEQTTKLLLNLKSLETELKDQNQTQSLLQQKIFGELKSDSQTTLNQIQQSIQQL